MDDSHLCVHQYIIQTEEDDPLHLVTKPSNSTKINDNITIPEE